MQIEPFADDVPLNGPDKPKVQQAIDLIRYLATVVHRFGNTVVTCNMQLQWGSSALWMCDELRQERNDAINDLERLNEVIASGFQSRYAAELEKRIIANWIEMGLSRERIQSKLDGIRDDVKAVSTREAAEKARETKCET